jgi:signal transduction histidine kinase
VSPAPEPRARAGEPRQPRRLRLTLTLWYAAALMATLLLAVTSLRFAVRRTLEREFDASVEASAALVRQFFRTEIAEYLTIEATLTHIAGELVFEDRAIRVLRPDGGPFAVAGRASRLPALPEPVRRARAPLDPRLAPGWELEVTASLAGLRAMERRLDRWFLVGVPLLGLLSVVGGWWITGRTLRPMGAMAEAATRIAPAGGERLPIADPDDELGRLGLRFNALLDRLDGALAQQRRFLADAAHELRTPLARLRARLDLATLAAAQGTPTDALLPALQEELGRMGRLVDELLQLARADAEAAADVTPTDVVPLYVDDIVADELAQWRPRAEQAGLALACSVLEEAPVAADPVLLRRLLGILLDNAVQYTPTGGQVDVRVRRDGDAVLLEVEDSGIGIPEADRPLVTERFFRAANARAHRADGGGLGLSIAQWIAGRHGGTLAFTAAPVAGTIATLRLPAVHGGFMSRA